MYGSPPIWAQIAATGALTGTITDSTGAAVPEAHIKVISEATGETREVASQTYGAYFVPQLTPGSYRVEVSKNGFQALSRPGLQINVTETTRLDLRLEVGAVSQKVTVEASAVLVQTESNALGRVVSDTVATSLPLVTRNYTQIIGLSPGIAQSVTNAAALGIGSGGLTSETEGQGMFVHGARQCDNNFQMDGVQINDLAGSEGESGGIAIPHPDTIQEFKVPDWPI